MTPAIAIPFHPLVVKMAAIDLEFGYPIDLLEY
jgi:hypothetical protein